MSPNASLHADQDESALVGGPFENGARSSAAPAPPVELPPHRRPTLLAGLQLVMRHPSLGLQIINAQLHRRRRIRIPRSVRLRGRAWIGGGGRITLGERVRINGDTVRVELVAWPRGHLSIGEGTCINYGTTISAHQSVYIGRDSMIGQYAIINDNDYHDLEHRYQTPPSQPVVLEDRVWLGARVIVLPGVRIGHDSVISAGSVVTRDIPAGCIAAGHPARVVRRLSL